jgi:ABC-type branched-subunit amino acid transport system substrate-binding protein
MRFRLLILTTGLTGIVTLALACGDDDGSSPSPSGGSPGPTAADVGPAEAVAVFAPAEGTHAVVEALLARDDIRLVLAAESSRDAASFDGLTVPGDFEIVGASTASTARANEAFEAAYEDAAGSPPDDTARQTYDAVYVAALAAAAANNSDPAAVATHVPYVANPPGEIIGPGADEFARALTLLAEGADVNYVGVSGLVDIDANGDLSKGAVEVWKLINGAVAPLETRDVDLAAEIEAENPPGSPAPAAEPPGDPLVGTTTTDMSAAEIATEEINAAGGVFGQPVQQIGGEGAAHIVIASAADTAPAEDVVVLSLSTTADPNTADDFLFRLAPPATLQAPVLANLAVEREIGVICVVHSDDPAGQAMATAFKTAFEHKGGAVRQVFALASGDEGDLLAECIGD